MSEKNDPLWNSAADHISGLEIAPQRVLAPASFSAVLPGCISNSAAQGFEVFEALVLHKGLLGEVPGDMLVKALDNFTPTFANEVFVVLSAKGERLADDFLHLPNRDWLLSTALSESTKGKEGSPEDRSRMAASFVGEGRVLLETAFRHLMLVDGRDTSIVPHLIRDGWFDRSVTDVIRGLLGPGMTFFDVGANFGTYTLIGAQEVGEKGRVVAVEPAPSINALLFENVTMNGFGPRTDVLRCAVGESAGTVTLHEFETRQGGNSVLPSVAEKAKATYGETVTLREVECRSLDAIIADLGIERIDLMKIDVEGFEYQAFLGARHMMTHCRPRIILEWHPAFFSDDPRLAKKLWALLVDEYSYRLHRIEADGTKRPVEFAELCEYEHSDLLGEPV